MPFIFPFVHNIEQSINELELGGTSEMCKHRMSQVVIGGVSSLDGLKCRALFAVGRKCLPGCFFKGLPLGTLMLSCRLLLGTAWWELSGVKFSERELWFRTNPAFKGQLVRHSEAIIFYLMQMKVLGYCKLRLIEKYFPLWGFLAQHFCSVEAFFKGSS